MSIFNQVQGKKPQHNTFDLSHQRKFDGKIGKLIPCFLSETVPNDKFVIKTSQLVRFAPMIAPVMHEFNIFTHYFFVPNRILWDNWEDFINGGTDGDETPTFPTISLNTETPAYGPGTLSDYLGLPTENIDPGMDVSAIPFAVYQKIWYDYYRDQNLIDNAAIDFLKDAPLDDGPNTANTPFLRALRNRAWEHDYFTSSLPWTQRGPEATIPLGTTADLLFKGYDSGPSQVGLLDGTDSNVGGFNISGDFGIPANSAITQIDQGGGVQKPVTLNVANSHEVDLSSATASSINDLRRAYRLQEWLELNARAGARYNETIIAHFGISPGDARLQRPEYLGGMKTPLVISEVLQTSSNAEEPTPQGNMAGHGVSVGGKNVVSYRTREHGYIIGIMSVMPKPAYQQGVPRHFFKFDKFDYYWKSFAQIGEQPVLNQEIYADTTDGENENIFGYVPRYAEYKYLPSTVHGEFKTTLDFWHDGRIFENRPVLNGTFIECDFEESARIFAVQDAEQFYVHMYHNVKAMRPMPYFGTPTI